MKKIVVALIFLILAFPAKAQLKIPTLMEVARQAGQANGFRADLQEMAQVAKSPKTADTSFYLVGGILLATTILDVESSFHALDSCPSCEEGNPIQRPFVKNGRLATYGFNLAADAALLGLSYHLKKQGYRSWWIMPTIAATTHGVSGGLNLRF